MRLLALVESRDHVCYRYRVAAFRQALAARGWTLEAVPVAQGNAERLFQLRNLPECDVLLVQRRLLPSWYAYALRQRVPRMVFDFDDAVFFRDSNSRKSPNSARRMHRFARLVRMCDAVIAGNGYLAEKTSRIIPAERVHMVPTCIDPSLYEPASHHRRDAATRLVWIGSGSTLASLEEARPHLALASAAVGGLSLHTICDEFPMWPELKIKRCRWTRETEAAEIAAGDIGVSWLPDHVWSHGKCGLKVLQYMATGLPVVCNPIAMHQQLVQHDRTGMLAKDTEGWVAAIKRLSESPSLRQEMGARGRETVLRDYSVSRWSSTLVDVLDRVAEDAASPALRHAA